MPTLDRLYRESLALLTDLYQLTMAHGYWKSHMAEREAVFSLTYRHNPFGGGFALACGLSYVVDLLRNFHFREDDLAYLGGLRGADGQPLFEPGFLNYLRRLRFTCDVDAVPEGTVVFPYEPLVRIRGPLIQAQLVETALLTLVNFQTLVATKAARVCFAAGGDPVLEFGLRRAQGVDGGLAASRAAFVGGCAATSNVLAGKLFDIPVRGTHAHSWVMAFPGELESFAAYAEAMPNNSLFLIDTYNTLQGARHAIAVGQSLRAAGHDLLGVRLDSGDLAELSVAVRAMLDEAGFPCAAIVASNDLDEHQIAELKQRGAKINVWGVGTRLATAYDQPALGGVYKLSALRQADGAWRDKIKLSENSVKVSDPGWPQTRRLTRGGKFVGDLLYDEQLGLDLAAAARDYHSGDAYFPLERTANNGRSDSGAALAAASGDPDGMSADEECSAEDLLAPVFRGGELVNEPPAAREAQARGRRQLAFLDDSIRRLARPAKYRLGMEERLWAKKRALVAAARSKGTP